MRSKVIGGLVAAGMLFAAVSDGRAQVIPIYPSGYNGPYPGYYTAYGAPGFHSPVYPVPAYSGAPAFPYPAAYGGYGYTYSYFTHVPGYSFTYYRGATPRYYPSQFGPIGGAYGYGPYGW